MYTYMNMSMLRVVYNTYTQVHVRVALKMKPKLKKTSTCTTIGHQAVCLWWAVASHLCCTHMTCNTHIPSHPSAAEEAWCWSKHTQHIAWLFNISLKAAYGRIESCSSDLWYILHCVGIQDHCLAKVQCMGTCYTTKHSYMLLTQPSEVESVNNVLMKFLLISYLR